MQFSFFLDVCMNIIYLVTNFYSFVIYTMQNQMRPELSNNVKGFLALETGHFSISIFSTISFLVISIFFNSETLTEDERIKEDYLDLL